MPGGNTKNLGVGVGEGPGSAVAIGAQDSGQIPRAREVVGCKPGQWVSRNNHHGQWAEQRGSLQYFHWTVSAFRGRASSAEGPPLGAPWGGVPGRHRLRVLYGEPLGVVFPGVIG